MRRSGPSIFSPDGSVTATVIGLGGEVRAARLGRARRRRRRSASGSAASSLPAAATPMPCRSPDGEWQLLHLAAKYFCAAAGVPDERVRRRRVARRRGPLAPGGRQDAVDVLRDRLDVFVRDPQQRRHPLVGARPADDRVNQFPRLVVQHDRRAQQIRSAGHAAAQVHPMARTAVDRVDAFPALDEHRIAGWALLRRKRRPSAPAAALTPAGRRGRTARGRRCLRRRRPEEPAGCPARRRARR